MKFFTIIRIREINVCLLLLFGMPLLAQEKVPAPALSLLNLGVHVQDEEGNSMGGVPITVFFYSGNPEMGSFTLEDTSLSLENKQVRFAERAFDTYIRLDHEGFWPTSMEYDWREAVDEKGMPLPEFRKDFTLMLRKIHNPRPLYVHSLDSIQPLRLYELNQKYGFDLEVGELVRPYGRGRRADMFFHLTGEVDNETRRFDVTTTISFPNEGDGILPVPRSMLGESQLLLGQEAPTDGYEPTFDMRVGIISDGRFTGRRYFPTMDEQAKWEGLWFRTHTELDSETGEVISARHGKIYSHMSPVILFGFSLETPRQKMRWEMEFIYFYAPDDSRSLEFNGETLVPNGNLQGVDKR
ncbi:MAG: hypothetical protein JJU29_15545 [Verrucomicrobia bacterium]|nr:hypothetical protein [Verrucomicrobiota bacterium]MCH8513380.1 hypothetical protein [Kiritimatiellia bacterium]